MRKLCLLLYRPFGHWLISAPRAYRFREFSFHVSRGVFHPGFFFSSKFLLSELLKESLHGKTVLDMGCGSGFIGIVAASRGAVVTSVDVNPLAVLATRQNAAANHQQLEVIQSNLFSELSGRSFDFIVINPPYYRKQPANPAEQAWFAGESLQYFQQLFSILKNQQPLPKVLMVLSEDCELDEIETIARQHGLCLMLRHKRMFLFEENYVFNIMPVRLAEKP